MTSLSYLNMKTSSQHFSRQSVVLGGSSQRSRKKMTENYTSADSIYDFTVKDLHDNDFRLTRYDNSQVLLIVNFATNDELADRNFLELKDLKSKFCDGKKRFKDKWRWLTSKVFTDLSILLFPCCQFGDPMVERENSEIFCWCKFEGIEFAQVFSMVNAESQTIVWLFNQNIDFSPIP